MIHQIPSEDFHLEWANASRLTSVSRWRQALQKEPTWLVALSCPERHLQPVVPTRLERPLQLVVRTHLGRRLQNTVQAWTEQPLNQSQCHTVFVRLTHAPLWVAVRVDHTHNSGRLCHLHHHRLNSMFSLFIYIITGYFNSFSSSSSSSLFIVGFE